MEHEIETIMSSKKTFFIGEPPERATAPIGFLRAADCRTVFSREKGDLQGFTKAGFRFQASGVRFQASGVRQKGSTSEVGDWESPRHGILWCKVGERGDQ